LITEGSSKLASVPSGGSGGGGAPAAGGAAAGGAAAEEKEEEKKEEGMFLQRAYSTELMLTIHREGRVRRGYGFRSLRLNSQLTFLWNRSSQYASITVRASGRSCARSACHLHAMGVRLGDMPVFSR